MVDWKCFQHNLSRNPQISRMVRVENLGWGDLFRMVIFFSESNVWIFDIFVVCSVNITMDAEKNVKCSEKKEKYDIQAN